MKHYKQRSGFAVWIVVVIAVLVITAGAYAATDGFSNFNAFGLGSENGEVRIVSKEPRDRVAEGIMSLFDYETNPVYDEYIGQTEMAKKASSGDVNFNLNISKLNMPWLQDLAGITIPEDMYMNWKLLSKQADMQKTFFGFGWGFADDELLTVNTFTSQELFQVAVPQLIKAVIGVDLTGDIAQKVNNAPLMQDATEEDKAQLTESLLLIKNNSDNESYVEVGDVVHKLETYKKLMDIFENYKKTWRIDPIDAKQFTVNGETKSYDGYNLLINNKSTADFIDQLRIVIKEDENLKADLDELYENSANFLSTADEPINSKEEFYVKIDEVLLELVAALKQTDLPNPQFTMYLDDLNRAVSFSTTFSYKGDEMSLNIEKNGGVTLDENMTAQLMLTEQDLTHKLVFKRSGITDANSSSLDVAVVATTDGAEQFNFAVNVNHDFAKNLWDAKMVGGFADEKFSVVSNGSYSNIVKGKRYTFNVDKFEAFYNQELTFGAKFQFDIDTEVDKVEQLSDQYIDFLEMTEKDAETLSEEAEANFMKIFMILEEKLQ